MTQKTITEAIVDAVIDHMRRERKAELNAEAKKRANEEDYALGHCRGSESGSCDDRDARLARGEGHVPRPEWMTHEQFDAVNTLYGNNADGPRDRHEFYSPSKMQCWLHRCAGIAWCGAFVIIEADRYHS